MYRIKFLDGSVKEFDDLVGKDLECSDLRGVDLSGADLKGVNLRHTNLEGVDLSGADLKDSDLRNANLEGADLSGADLENVDLRFANLRGTTFKYSDLRNANLCGVNLSGADLRDAYLQHTCLDEINGIISGTFGKHLAVAFKFDNVVFMSIGCKCLEVNKWIRKYKNIGVNNEYSKKEIALYGSFIKMIYENQESLFE